MVHHVKKEPLLYLMLLPAVAYFIIFKYIPIYGISIAFQDFSIARGYFHSEWVGLKHFEAFVTDPYFFRIVRNTIVLSLHSLVFGFPAPIILALLMNELASKQFKSTVQTLTCLPHYVSMVIVVGLLKKMFMIEGPINQFIVSMGLPSQMFLLDPTWFRPLYVISGIWQGAGWGAIIYLAALSGINVELYEAAYVDGANRWRRMWHISLPGIRPTITILLILSIGSLMGVGFEKVFLMYNPAVYEVADVIATYVYRRGLEQMQFSYATAVGFFNSVINLLLLVFANWLARKYSETSFW